MISTLKTPEDRRKLMLAEVEQLEAAMRKAAQDATLHHQRMNVPMVVCRDGKVVEIDPFTKAVLRVVESNK